MVAYREDLLRGVAAAAPYLGVYRDGDTLKGYDYALGGAYLRELPTSYDVTGRSYAADSWSRVDGDKVAVIETSAAARVRIYDFADGGAEEVMEQGEKVLGFHAYTAARIDYVDALIQAPTTIRLRHWQQTLGGAGVERAQQDVTIPFSAVSLNPQGFAAVAADGLVGVMGLVEVIGSESSQDVAVYFEVLSDTPQTPIVLATGPEDPVHRGLARPSSIDERGFGRTGIHRAKWTRAGGFVILGPATLAELWDVTGDHSEAIIWEYGPENLRRKPSGTDLPHDYSSTVTPERIPAFDDTPNAAFLARR